MYVMAIHSISNPEAFWGGEFGLSQGVCIF